MLAACLAAEACGVPAYLLATRDKFLDARKPVIEEDDPQKLWDEAPAGVRVVNEHFEEVPLRLVTLLNSKAHEAF